MYKIYVNGKFIDDSKATISIHDRGFKFGDGIFETILVHNQKLYNYYTHINRLFEGLKSIYINHNFSSSQLSEICTKLIKINNIEHAILRISITRGIGSKGYLPSTQNHSVTSPSIIIEVRTKLDHNYHQHLLQHHQATTVNLCISPYQKQSDKSLPTAYKLMANMNSILTKIHADQHNYFDAIMLTNNGLITETSSANIFWYKNGKLHTPKNNILLGTIRQKIIALSPLPIILGDYILDDLLDSEEIFITNIGFLVKKVTKICTIDHNIIYQNSNSHRDSNSNISQQILLKILDDITKS